MYNDMFGGNAPKALPNSPSRDLRNRQYWLEIGRMYKENGLKT